MGHLGQLSGEYRSLLGRLEAGQVALPEPEDPTAREGWRELLEILFTPEEAELASKLPLRPASIGTIARRVGLQPEALAPRLDAMCDKGLVMDLVNPRTGEVRYLLSPPVVGFFEFSFMRAHEVFPQQRLAEAMDAYMRGDRTFAQEVFGTDTVIGRALVDEEQVAEETLPEVLDWERATELIRGARSLGVALCYCRHKAEHLGRACDAPQEICLSLNGGAEFLIRRGFARAIAKEEALDILRSARRAGLVQIADNVQRRPTYICNCCGCCCEQLRAINELGLRAVNPSGFLPRRDDDRCRGCTRCARFCPTAAIEMTASRRRGKRRGDLEPRIDPQRCIGCGVCAGQCRQEALVMERSGERRHVPLMTLERTVRMALERGRLAHLLFDQGESRGARFLNRAVLALTRLPAADRLLAIEQVRSRYLQHIMNSMRSSKRAARPLARSASGGP